MRIYLTDLQEYLDLGETELIFNDSIKAIQELGVNGAEFSDTFTVPATAKNNTLLKHYYRNDIVGGLDARKFIKCQLLYRQETLKTGGLVIENSSVENGRAVNYKLRFHSFAVDFKGKIAQDSLRELTTGNLNLSDVSWRNMFTDNSVGLLDIVTPLGSTKNRLVYDSFKVDSTQIEKTKNIAQILFNSTGTFDNKYYGLSGEDITPAMRVGKIIDLIEDKYDITINGVLKQQFVSDLYLWLNRTGRGVDTYQGWSTGMTSVDGTFNWGSFNAAVYGYIKVDAPTEDYYFTVKMEDSGVSGATQQLSVDGKVVAAFQNGSGTSSETRLTKESLITTESYSKTAGVTLSPRITITKYNSDGTTETHRFDSNNNVKSNPTMVIRDRMPNITVKQFLVNLFKMFNIVAEFEDGVLNTYLYDYWIYTGNTVDLSKFSTETKNVSPVNRNATINFGFKNGGTAIETGYETMNARSYGSLYYSSSTLDGQRSLGNGDKVQVDSVALPLEKLSDIRDDSFTDIAIAQWVDVDGNTKGDKPCFTYVVKGTQSIAFNNDAGQKVSTGITSYKMASNIWSPTAGNPPIVKDVDDAGVLGLYFGQEINEYKFDVNYPNNGLYNWFYRGYIAKVWDTDNRLVKMKMRLNAAIIRDIKLNDNILINNQYYLINSMKSNPETYEVDFELVAVGSSLPDEFKSKFQTISKASGSHVGVGYIDTNGVVQYALSTTAISFNSIGGVKTFASG